MSFEFLKGIIGIPSSKYKYTCKSCKKPFSTRYVQQVFCLDPCTALPARAEKKDVTKMTRSQNSARKKEIEKEAEALHKLNRKYLSMKL